MNIGILMIAAAGIGAFALYIHSVYQAGIRRGMKLSWHQAGLVIPPLSFAERKRLEHDRAGGRRA